MSPSPLTLRTAWILTVPPLLWAGNAVVGRLVAASVPPLGLNFVRWLLTALVLAPLAWRVLRTPAVLRARWGYLSVLGLLGMGSYNALQYSALHTISPMNVTLITASAPVWTLALGAVFFRTRPSRGQMLGAGLSLLGVVTVITRGHLGTLAGLHFAVGDLLMIGAILTWTVYSWLLARPPATMRAPQRPDWDWSAFLFAQVLFGLLPCAVSAGVEVGLAPWSGQDVDWHWSPLLLGALAYVVVGPSILAYRFWGQGVAQAGPAVAAFFINLMPLFAAVLSGWLLGEWPQGYHALAFALIVGGIWVSSRGSAA